MLFPSLGAYKAVTAEDNVVSRYQTRVAYLLLPNHYDLTELNVKRGGRGVSCRSTLFKCARLGAGS